MCDLITILVGAVIVNGISMYLVHIRLKGERIPYIYYTGILALSFILGVMLIRYEFDSLIINIILGIIIGIFSTLYYKQKKIETFCWVMNSRVIMYICVSVEEAIYQLLLNVTILAKLISIVLCICLAILMVYLLTVNIDDNNFTSTKNLLLMTTVSFTVNIYVILIHTFSEYQIMQLTSFESEFKKFTYQTILIMCITLLTIYTIFRVIVSTSIKSEKRRTKLKKAELENIHYNEVKSLYQATREWREEYKKHIEEIKNLSDEDKLQEVVEYIDGLIPDSSKLDFVINTGNELLDAIINVKRKMAENIGIKFHANINVIINEDFSQVDLITLIANLLDNAIEGCERSDLPKEGKIVVLNMSSIKGQLAIYIKNTATNIVLQENDKYVSSKTKPGHGIGLNQIDTIVEKYKGYINRNAENGYFETYIRLSDV